jgi:6-phosphogluconolactonase (cycloisomerase 2 family)
MGIKTSFAAVVLMAAVLSGCGSYSNQIAYITYPGENGVAAFRMNNDNGTFTSIIGSPFPAGSSPATILMAPSGKFAYASNQTDNTISLLAVDHQTGLLQEILPRTPARVGPAAMVMNSGGTFLFVANAISSNISVYAMDSSSGALTEVNGSPFATGSTPSALAISPNGNYLYVSNSNLATVSGYAIGSDGSLQAIPGSPFASGKLPRGLAISPSGKFLYVANSQDGTISGFTINSSTGALNSIPGSPWEASITTGSVPVSLVVDPSEKFVLVALYEQTTVSGFSLNENSGALAQIAAMTVTTTGNPALLGFDSTGKYLLVLTNGTGEGLYDFTIGLTGATEVLTSVSGTSTLASAPGSFATTM